MGTESLIEDHLIVPEHIAILAKENGFEEICFAFFQLEKIPYSEKGLKIGFVPYIGNHNKYGKDSCSAPFYQQLIDWFREKHKLSIIVAPSLTIGKWYFNMTFTDKICWDEDPELQDFHSYYECMNFVLEYAFKVIKEKNEKRN